MIIWRLAYAEIKKNKSLTVALLFLSFLAALFLSTGLLLQEEIKTAYQHCAQRLKSPDFLVVTEGSKYKTSYEEFLIQDKRVEFVEKEEIIYMESTKNSVNSLKTGAVIFNIDVDRKIEPIHLLKEDTSVPMDKAIYLPRVMEDSGVSLGEMYTLTYKNMDYEFQVAGFFETSYMGTTTYAYMKYFVPNNRFLELYENVGSGKALSAKLKNGLDKLEISKELKNDFLEETNYYNDIGGLLVISLCLSYDEMRNSMMSILGVPMMLLISMSVIIGIINAIIVYVKVKESIADNMVNIGSLQAMGYTTGQILLSKIAEFSVLGFAGGSVGTAFVYVILPFNLKYSQGIVGIVIEQGVNIWINILSAACVLAVMFVTAIFGAWRIKKISPVTALRKGVHTHYFRKNFFPLQKGQRDIRFRLALKSICGDAAQSVTTIMVLGLGVFAVALSVVLYANFGYDISAITKMTGIEIADIQVIPVAGTDIPELKKELENMSEVRKTSQTESYMAKIDEEDLQLIITDDFSKLETVTVSVGDMPKYDNEIALTSTYLKAYDKSIGDTVEVTSRGITKEYIIVGSSLGTNSGGKMGLMSTGGIRRVDPYFSLNQINVYLKDTSKRDSFMDKLYADYGVASTEEDTKAAGDDKFAAAKLRAEIQIKKMLDQYGIKSVSYAVMQDGQIILEGDSNKYKIKDISSLSEYLDGQLASYIVMMNGIMGVILSVMLIVIGTIISITVKSKIRRKREEFGIYKSIGYTTKDIVKIIRLEMGINAVVGSVLGGAACKVFGNQILKVFFYSFGLSLEQFMMKTSWLAGTALLMVVYVCILSTYKAYQVKKISVYELLTE